MAEHELLLGLQQGTEQAYREVFRLYGPSLLGYARKMLRDRDDAEEVVQDTVVAVFQHVHRFEGRCSVRSWLFRIVHHKIIDHLRKSSRFVQEPEEGPYEYAFTHRGKWLEMPEQWSYNPESQADARELLRLVRDLMEELPHNYREILSLKEVYQLETKEICNVLGVSAVHARVMLHRARQSLYQLVEKALKAPVRLSPEHLPKGSRSG
ncbi:MAG: sigma-70 family RNA polymerase sigma factor [Myxococcota bacterium]